MNEQIRINPELTARRQYSTLNTRSTMAQDGNNEVAQRQQRQPNRPQPEHPTTQRLHAETIGEMMRTVNPQAAREAARAIIEVAQASGKTLTPDQRKLVSELGYQPVLAGGEDTPLNDDFNPEFDKEHLEEFLQSDRRQAVVGDIAEAGVTDPVFRNILSTFNHDARSERVGRSDEYALQSISNTIKSLTDRLADHDFPESEREVALQKLDQLKDAEIKLIVSSQRERTPQELEQLKTYNMTLEFEKEFVTEIDHERRGEQDKIDPQRKKLFREARQFLIKKVEKQIEEAPSIEASRFPPLIMEMASKFKETREMLINEILFKPYADKTQQGHYELNLYASGNLDELLATLARRAKNPEYKADRETFEWYQALKTTSRNFWEMNRGLWTGNLEVFSRIAEEMNFDQFQTMQRIPGVAETMRLYDDKFLEAMGKYHRITSQNLEEIKRKVREEMIKMNEMGLMTSQYYDQREGSELEKRKLESWELDRAINVGFVFFNITFRGPELTSIGQLETGDKRYASFPYENAARMLNVIMTAERFEIAKERGGIEFVERARANLKRQMRKDGRHLGVNRFTEINGVKVDDLEYMANLGISGIFSGWRMSTAAYEGISITIGGKKTNLWDYMKEKKLVDNVNEVGLQEYISSIRDDKSLTLEKQQDLIVEALNPLIGKNGALDVGLGMLLRLGQGNQGVNGFLSGKEGFKARQLIWERIAEKNQLTMINILTNLMEDGGKGKQDRESGYSLKNILERNGWTTEHAEWKALKSKLQIQHEIKVKQQSKNAADREYAKGLLKRESVKLSPEEEVVLGQITAAGKAISKDLADIVFPYMAFMNDMPFEKFNWSGPGAQFFKRRIGDIGNYNKSISAVLTLMDNLGGMKPEDVAEKGLKEIQRGIESPNGPGSGFTAVLPYVLAYFEMAQTYEGLDSQVIVKDTKRMLKKPTSRLQSYSGVHAPSLDQATAYDYLHLLRYQGTIDHHAEEIIRKERKLTLWDLILAAFRDLAPVFLMSMAIDLPKSTVSLKAA